jgi:hypothetical protein
VVEEEEAGVDEVVEVDEEEGVDEAEEEVDVMVETGIETPRSPAAIPVCPLASVLHRRVSTTICFAKRRRALQDPVYPSM